MKTNLRLIIYTTIIKPLKWFVGTAHDMNVFRAREFAKKQPIVIYDVANFGANGR